MLRCEHPLAVDEGASTPGPVLARAEDSCLPWVLQHLSLLTVDDAHLTIYTTTFTLSRLHSWCLSWWCSYGLICGTCHRRFTWRTP